MNSQAEPYFTTQMNEEEPMKQPHSNRKKNQSHKSDFKSRKQSFKNSSDSEELEDLQTSGEVIQQNTFPNCVLYVSHLPISFSNVIGESPSFNATNLFPNQLFNIFSCFGEVLRVKIMSNDRTKALILFADPSQATKALVMNGVVFRGETLQVRFSTSIYVDPVGYNTCPSVRDLTEDYYGKIVHRFNSMEYSKIPWHMPSKKLHIIGFDGTNPEMKNILTHMFSNCGKVENVSVLKNMAWIDMDSVESATNAVALIHNSNLYTLPGKLLRVSYATYGNK